MPSTAADQRRAHERVASRAEVRIGTDDRWQECRLINISVGGARLQLAEPLAATQPILDIVGYGRFRATVAWQQGNDVGIRFDHDPEEIAQVVVGLATYG